MSTPRTYNLTGGDDGAYGPTFGPVLAEEMGEISSNDGNHLILKLRTALNHNSDVIEYILVKPRYSEDSLETLKKDGCIVGIGRILPGKETEIKQTGIHSATVAYWSIGSCTPTH